MLQLCCWCVDGEGVCRSRISVVDGRRVGRTLYLV